jgi:hypothetical protein
MVSALRSHERSSRIRRGEDWLGITKNARRARDSPKGIPQEILPHFLRENPQVLADAGFSRRDPLTRIIHRSGQDRCSGERGIRTPKSLRTPVFKTGAIAVLPALQKQTNEAIVDPVFWDQSRRFLTGPFCQLSNERENSSIALSEGRRILST